MGTCERRLAGFVIPIRRIIPHTRAGMDPSDAPALRTTLDCVMEGCQLVGFDWRYLYLNGAAAIHNRRPNEELLGRKMTEVWPRTKNNAFFAMLQRAMVERVALHEETEFEFPDGNKGWFDVRCQPVPEGLFILSIDIGARKRHERELERLRRLYAALSQINQAIVRMPKRDELFQKVCQILVEDGGFRMAWIGLPSPESHRLMPAAAWGDENGYLRSISVYTDDRPEGHGPSGTAFRDGRPVISNDMLNDPAMLPWRVEAGAARLPLLRRAAHPAQERGLRHTLGLCE